MKKVGWLTLGLALLVGLNVVHAGEPFVKLGGLSSKIPETWTMQKPSGTLRKYQAALPKAPGDKEDAELAVFSFGGSGVEENLARWKLQFSPPMGKTIDEVSKVEKYKIGKIAEVVCLDISGTFKYKFPPNDPKAKEVRKENFRRFNVMLIAEDGTYFITLTGPAKTMAKNKEAFDGWIKAFK